MEQKIEKPKEMNLRSPHIHHTLVKKIVHAYFLARRRNIKMGLTQFKNSVLLLCSCCPMHGISHYALEQKDWSIEEEFSPF